MNEPTTDDRIAGAIHAYAAGQLDQIPRLEDTPEPKPPTPWDDPLYQDMYNLGRATMDRVWQRMVALADWLRSLNQGTIEATEDHQRGIKAAVMATQVIARTMLLDWVADERSLPTGPGWDRESLHETIAEIGTAVSTLDREPLRELTPAEIDDHAEALAEYIRTGEMTPAAQTAADEMEARKPGYMTEIERIAKVMETIREIHFPEG
jgi:hypothetical protein